jgi:hypothetical protein
MSTPIVRCFYSLAERGFTGEIAIVARDDQQGEQLWLAGAPIILYPFRDAVDFAAENIIAIMNRQAREDGEAHKG